MGKPDLGIIEAGSTEPYGESVLYISFCCYSPNKAGERGDGYSNCGIDLGLYKHSHIIPVFLKSKKKIYGLPIYRKRD